MTNDKREQARVLREDVDASVRAAANMLPAQMGKELAAVEAGAAALMREAEADENTCPACSRYKGVINGPKVRACPACGTQLVRVEVKEHPGKTIQQCPKCEKERRDKFMEMFYVEHEDMRP